MDVSIGYEIYTIYGDPKVAQECNFATVQKVKREEESIKDSQAPRIEIEGEYKLFVFDQLKLDQMVQIGRGLSLNLRMQLAESLTEYENIFT